MATPAALKVLADSGAPAPDLLDRHVRGDWGEVPPEDACENEISLREGFRILSSYPVGDHRLWIITEADHSSTCTLPSAEYWQPALESTAGPDSRFPRAPKTYCNRAKMGRYLPDSTSTGILSKPRDSFSSVPYLPSQPPSTGNTEPWMKSPAADESRTTAPLRSSGSP